MTYIDYLVTIIVALISSSGFFGLVQTLTNRRGRKAVAARDEAEAEKARLDKKKAAVDRASMLVDAQALAQATALNSADMAYSRVANECAACREELGELRVVTEVLLTAIAAMIDRARPGDPLTVTTEELDTVHTAMRSARSHLY